jgi:hypothetical protein
MENVKRKLFFWTLVILFLITAPAVVLHARGYRFDLNRGVFVYSGAITFKTNPQNVKVLINNQLNESKQLNRINSSYNITGFLPGDYEIKIFQDGYQPWSKKTEVHSGLSSEFWNIVLVRNEYQKMTSDAENVDRFFMSPKNDFITYTQNLNSDLTVSIFNFNLEKTEKTFTFSGWSIISQNKKENIEWSPQEDYLSVPVEKEVTTDISTVKGKKLAAIKEPANKMEYGYFIVNPADSTSFNLNDLLGKKNIQDVRWDPKDKDYIFFLEGANLFRANITDKTDMTLINSDVSSFDLSKSGVYFITSPNNLVFKTALDGKSQKDQITAYFPEQGRAVERMIVYDDARIGFIDIDKKLFVYNKGDKDTYFRELGSAIEGIHFSDDGKKMLFWNNNEVFVYFARVWEVQPVRAENEVTNITRYSEPISNVQWFKDYEHVIFSTGRWIKLIELDNRDHRNCMDFLNTSTDTPFVRYNNYLEKLYFTDVKDNKTILQSIKFPEPVPILGIGG